jgi:hypothetical protein
MGLSPAGRTRRYVPALRRRLLFRLATSDTYERLVRALPPIATAASDHGARPVASVKRSATTIWVGRNDN